MNAVRTSRPREINWREKPRSTYLFYRRAVKNHRSYFLDRDRRIDGYGGTWNLTPFVPRKTPSHLSIPRRRVVRLSSRSYQTPTAAFITGVTAKSRAFEWRDTESLRASYQNILATIRHW